MSCTNWGFCDLFVCRTYDLSKLDEIEKLGFNTIALNTHVEEETGEPKRKKKKKGDIKEQQDFIPPPLDISKEIKNNTNLNLLQRVTIEFSDSSIAHKMNQSENLKKYDIVAVIPKSLQAFQYACGSMDIDLISFEPESKLPFKVSRKLFRQAVERGIFFELMYSSAIRDSSSRKNIISIAHTYHAVGKSRNIILSSGAGSHIHLRSVYDVINLGAILGLNNNKSLEVIRNNSRRLILKGQGRRCGKLFMTVQSNDEKNIENNNDL